MQDVPRYWVIAPFDVTLPAFEQVWQFDLTNGVISLGWSELGDISALDWDAIKALVEENFPNYNPSSITRVTNMLWKFFHEIHEEDIVLAQRGRNVLAAVGTVKRTAYFDPNGNPELTDNFPDKINTYFLGIRWHDAPRDLNLHRIVFGMQTIYGIGEAEYLGLIGAENILEVEVEQEVVKNRPQFFLEKYLEQFIIDNFQTIFEGRLTLLRDDDGNAIGQQYRTDVGNIDILAL